jgi:hypothetical protein
MMYYFFWVILWHLNLYADILEHNVCSIFIGGVSRKNNRDEIVGLFIQEKVWLENSLSQSEGVGQTGECPSRGTVSSWLFFLLTPPMKMEQTDCSKTLAYKI